MKDVVGLPQLISKSRTIGPPAGDVCGFQSESLPGSSFVAYGLGDGTLVISKVIFVMIDHATHVTF